jgi:hypothetical protein
VHLPVQAASLNGQMHRDIGNYSVVMTIRPSPHNPGLFTMLLARLPAQMAGHHRRDLKENFNPLVISSTPSHITEAPPFRQFLTRVSQSHRIGHMSLIALQNFLREKVHGF